MMWLFASLLILISAGGSFSEEDEVDCIDQERAKCSKFDDLPPASSVNTVEELLKVCRIKESSLSCIADAHESCDLDDGWGDWYVAALRRTASYLKTTCQEDNPIFQAVYNNLECITNVIKSSKGACLWRTSYTTHEILNEHVNNYFDEDRLDLLDCLYDVTEISCQAITYGYHCGTEVRKTIEEILENTLAQMSICTPELLDELEPYLEMFEALLVEDLGLEKALVEKDNE